MADRPSLAVKVNTCRNYLLKNWLVVLVHLIQSRYMDELLNVDNTYFEKLHDDVNPYMYSYQLIKANVLIHNA